MFKHIKYIIEMTVTYLQNEGPMSVLLKYKSKKDF